MQLFTDPWRGKVFRRMTECIHICALTQLWHKVTSPFVQKWIIALQLRMANITHENKVRGALRNNRSEEHTSELQSRLHLVCRLLLEKKNNTIKIHHIASTTKHHTCITSST